MLNVLVTGGKGQLANNLKDIEAQFSNINMIFKDSKEVDITDTSILESLFNTTNIDYCINCAAYTSVDMAESEYEKASRINELGPKNLALICEKNNAVLIHISTDFVFNGNKAIPYTELDKTEPQGVYGLTKLKGELVIVNSISRYFIIRTSWLYSEHNNNFFKTMLRLSKDRNEIGVIDDQIGTPTYAKDLAEVLLKIINSKNVDFGVYHYSNEGVSSWYDFAQAIFDETKTEIKLIPIKTKDYKTPAKRPYFSVMDKTKIKNNFNLEIPYWRHSLRRAIQNLNKPIKEEK